MKCYKCSTEMKRKALDGVLVDACPVCEGIWLDGGELEMLRRGERKGVEELLIEARKEIVAEKRRLVTAEAMCPRCQKDTLCETVVAGTVLDVCSGCAGIFFDWSELARVLRAEESTGFRSFIGRVRGLIGLSGEENNLEV